MGLGPGPRKAARARKPGAGRAIGSNMDRHPGCGVPVAGKCSEGDRTINAEIAQLKFGLRGAAIGTGLGREIVGVCQSRPHGGESRRIGDLKRKPPR